MQIIQEARHIDPAVVIRLGRKVSGRAVGEGPVEQGESLASGLAVAVQERRRLDNVPVPLGFGLQLALKLRPVVHAAQDKEKSHRGGARAGKWAKRLPDRLKQRR